jgi:spore coat polysaccharide biosynthesis protein SpsF
MGKSAIAVIQARMSSTRLRGKVMLPLAGHPVIWHIVDRVKQCQLIDTIVVATSTDASDEPLAEYLANNNIACYRGSLTNVLNRFLVVLNTMDHTLFVRITGDCPLIEPKFIDEQIRALDQFDADVVWLKQQSSILEGQGVHSTRSMKYIQEHSNDPADKEHAGNIYLSRHPEEFRIVEMHIPEEYCVNGMRLTIDEEGDYKLFSAIYDKLWKNKPVNLLEVVDWLKSNPGIVETNRTVKQSAVNRQVSEDFKKWDSVPKAGVYHW